MQSKHCSIQRRVLNKHAALYVSVWNVDIQCLIHTRLSSPYVSASSAVRNGLILYPVERLKDPRICQKSKLCTSVEITEATGP